LTAPAGAPRLELRAAAPADEPFLRRLYADAGGAELARLSLEAAAHEALLRMQFDARDRSYAAAHPEASNDLVLVDGVPAGRLWVDRSGRDIWLIDIALLSDYRARGLGRRLLIALIDEARERGCAVRLHVERHNPARRLYERLGFGVVSDGEVYLELVCVPEPAHDDQANTAS